MVTLTLSALAAKEAARRLREFLAAGGINLKQTHAYEALAQTLGYANWNTLQALLSSSEHSSVDGKKPPQRSMSNFGVCAAAFQRRIMSSMAGIPGASKLPGAIPH